MEKILPFETFADKVDFKASSAELSKRQDIADAKKIAAKMEQGTEKGEAEKEVFRSPGLKLHSEYCKYLGLDAPLHHTTNIPPTVPSTLHLTCHRLPWHGVTIIHDVCYHAPMKPHHAYNRSVVLMGEGTSKYLSLIKDESSGQVMSSVIYEYDKDLYDKQILVGDDGWNGVEVGSAQHGHKVAITPGLYRVTGYLDLGPDGWPRMLPTINGLRLWA